MTTIRLEWTWKLNSALHCGSGLSCPGVADNLVQKDADGKLWIPGEAVRGVLRMSAEQVAVWLGKSQQGCYDPTPTAPWEPKALPLACIFGNGRSHVSPATITTDSRPATLVVASTAVHSELGTAKDNTLRKTELAVGDLGFTASLFVRVAEGLVDIAETLLVASLATSEAIGGKAGIGSGRLTLFQPKLYRDDKPIDPLTAVSRERLSRLRTAFDEKVGPGLAVSPIGETASVKDSDFEWFQLDVVLREPTCLSGQPEISNTVVTEHGIRATALRGALQRFWREQGVPQAEIHSYLSERTRWSPGLPVEEDVVFVPSPLCFGVPKGTSGLGPQSCVIDALRDERAPKNENGRRLNVRPIAARCIGLREGLLAGISAMQETRMHVARDYWSGSKRSGALYSRESLSPKNAFRAWVYLPVAAFNDRGSISLLLGKRTAAGNGLADVTVQRLGPSFRPFDPAPVGTEDSDVFVNVLSPAIVRDTYGHPLQGLIPEDWVRLVGASVQPLDLRESGVRSAVMRRGGWMVNWGHQRAGITAIQPGSVWRLQCKTPAEAARLRSALTGLGQIGERLHEGFGWIAVDPPWIRKKPAPPVTMTVRSAGAPLTLGRLRLWSGMEEVPRQDMLAVLNEGLRVVAALSRADCDDLQAPLRELAQRARSVRTPVDNNRLVDFWRSRTREHGNGRVHLRWKNIMAGRPAAELLSKYWSSGVGRTPNPKLLRFALEVLLALTRPEREVS